MSSLTQWTRDLETYFGSVKSTAEQFLAEHVPGLIDLARKVESSPLLSAAQDVLEVIDPAAEVAVANALKALAAAVPPKPQEAPAPEPAPEPAPAQP